MDYIDRPPRIQPELPIGEVTIPAPPKSEAFKQPLWQSMVPIITIIGYAIVSVTGQGSNIAFLLPMALAMFLSTGIAVYNGLRNRRIEREKKAAYDQRLVEMRQQMMAAHDKQRAFYQYTYPGIHDLFAINGKTQNIRSGTRLWERRPDDVDFGVVRLGLGTRPSTVVYNVAEAENEENPQMHEAERLAADSEYLQDAPITLPLYQPPDSIDKDPEDRSPILLGEVHHAVGISGTKNDVYGVIRNILLQLAVLHSPVDMQFYITGLANAKPEWDWIEKLPHANGRVRFEQSSNKYDTRGNLREKDKDEIITFMRLLWGELDRRSRRLREKAEGEQVNVTLPFQVLVIDLLDARPGDKNDPLQQSAFREIDSDAAISLLLQQGPRVGGAVIFLVPERNKIPSGCNAVIELNHDSNGQTTFLYAQTGLNTLRFVGTADVVQQPATPPTPSLTEYSGNLAKLKVRRSFGSEVPTRVGFLQLFDADIITDLNISQQWQESKRRERADWLDVAIGIVSGNEKRRLKFSADADGVHGMIAGSTGSGKSELLMTLIMGLAIKYDPSIVNFVLVDYKGGAAFDPFDTLPHAVDKVTNLGPGAVARMFAAINAELNRRQKINSDYDVKHIVEYRKRGLHERRPYPHLFIVIDEFAEMIANNSEYRAQLESITRLGRSLGVSLILAAQRPAGVSDQMRANIKFRISLRVETREESNELLRKPDAAYLPNGVPGRGYLQVGNDNLQEIQVAWTGADYTEPDAAPDDNIIVRNLHKLRRQDIIWLDELEEEQNKEKAKLFEVLVSRMARMAETENNRQLKPWPSPLPRYLALDDPGDIVNERTFSETKTEYILAAELSDNYLLPEDLEYLTDARDNHTPTMPLTLSPAVTAWIRDLKTAWSENIEWDSAAVRAVIGLIDDPSNAKLRLLRVNLKRGHVVVFGAAGWGKTTFLRALVADLIASHSPQQLHLYMLDFGSSGLNVFSDIPHTGAYIVTKESERVQRLMRFLEEEIERRKKILSDASSNSVYTYNMQAEKPLASIVVLIDNFAEMRETYEDLLSSLASLLRDGLSTGVHFVVTADQVSALGKMFTLFPERYALKLSDASETTTIVGRGARMVDETPGRGFVAIDRVPLEFQVAVPIGVSLADRSGELDETKRLKSYLGKIESAWKLEARPPQINALPEFEPFKKPEPIISDAAEINIGLGIDDTELKLTTRMLSFKRQAHFVIVGAPVSGKTTALHTAALWLAYQYSPQQVAMVFIDRQGKLADYGGNQRLDNLPHVLERVITEPEQFEELVDKLANEYENYEEPRQIFVLIDNYDDIDDLAKNKDTLKRLGNLGRRFSQKGLHFVVAGTQSKLRTADDFTRPTIAQSRYGIAMDADNAGSAPLSARVPQSYNQLQLPPGRGFLVQSGRIKVMQIASPYVDEENRIEALNKWISEAMTLHKEVARSTWRPMKFVSIQEKPEADTNGATATTKQPKHDMQKLRQALAEQMGVSVDESGLNSAPDEAILGMAASYSLIETTEE